jgi:ATP-dependent Lon protease
MSKELVFKVVLEGDTKDYVSNIQQSEDTTKAVFEAIKQEAEKLRQASAETAKQIGEIVPESTTKMASALTQNLNNATTAIQNAGTNAGATAKNFAEFGRVSEQALGVLKSDLDQAKQKLHDLSTTNATPQDIEAAQHAVNELERQVEQADEALIILLKRQIMQIKNWLKQRQQRKAEAGFTFLKTTIGTLAAGLAALGLGLTINELIATSDATQQMASRLRNATDSVEEYNLVQERLLELANTTARPLMKRKKYI